MSLKHIVGFSLIAFLASMSMILVVGLVLTHQKPAPVQVAVDVPTEEPSPSVDPSASPGASPTAKPVVYCNGKTPCYGKSTLAAHTSSSSCWGYNLDWMINLTGYAPIHPNGPQYVVNNQFCGKDVHGALTGAVAIGYTHTHLDVTQTNASNSILASYRVGYYDPNKP